jgi:DNA-binding transcriptional ArsR family regulator
MRQLPHPGRDDLQLTTVLHALSDPTRLSMVRSLWPGGERSCSSFDGIGGLSAATLSHHFRVLRDAGVTRTRLDRNRRHMSLRRDDLDARFPGVIGAIIAADDAMPGRAPVAPEA